ncbi:MAG: glycerophosphodiester phosphodiesterase [Promethearchaeota archaeon]|jgi:glycerophosphoryl diester phosphodiesterase
MNKTFIWGHRGSGFIGTQNSLSSFRRAIEMGVDGVKSEAQLSKDKEIFLTFNQSLKINGGDLPLYELESSEIKEFKLDKNEPIITLSELFEETMNSGIRYNLDVRSPEVGIRVCQIARDFDLTNRIELAKTSIDSFSLPEIFDKIRKTDKNVTLINSVFLKYTNIEEKHLEVESMNKLNIQGINVHYNLATPKLFKMVKDLGFKFYIWGVLFNRSIRKCLTMSYKGQYVDAMMSNFPHRLVKLRNEIQNN